MQIIISPAKQMRVDTDSIEAEGQPFFLEETKKLLSRLKTFDRGALRELFRTNEKITEENYLRYACMDLEKGRTPALLSYVGLQYQYMAPQVFTVDQWEYVRTHLWILSGFYGMLRPKQGITPYRLEMQARLSVGEAKDLYAFWGDRLYKELVREEQVVLNLASKEYSKAIEPYLKQEIRYVTCVFGSLQEGKVKVKGTEAKMARGEMVRWLSMQQIEEPEDVRKFEGLGFSYCADRSGPGEYVFLKTGA
ncbi:MAG: peroxide stress protein YaaA [Lachnospiraceae bacterium]|nr:peroxide stress protein YaaA [Lachnospiraceae bacterium]MCI9479799.1 peroxide stress protein YaaA [Lachnospiraceae bacterium]